MLVGFDDKGKGNHSVSSTFTTLVFDGKKFGNSWFLLGKSLSILSL